jgi:hypothetical protein
MLAQSAPTTPIYRPDQILQRTASESQSAARANSLIEDDQRARDENVTRMAGLTALRTLSACTASALATEAALMAAPAVAPAPVTVAAAPTPVTVAEPATKRQRVADPVYETAELYKQTCSACSTKFSFSMFRPSSYCQDQECIETRDSIWRSC